jgi:ACR3 family arsenite efflux pump ArsB
MEFIEGVLAIVGFLTIVVLFSIFAGDFIDKVIGSLLMLLLAGLYIYLMYGVLTFISEKLGFSHIGHMFGTIGIFVVPYLLLKLVEKKTKKNGQTSETDPN